MTDDKINIAELAHIGRTGKLCEDACRTRNAESGCYCAMVADALIAQAAEIARLTAERDYDRKQSEHKSSVIDKLNAALASAAEKAEAEIALQPDPDARQADLAKAFCMGRDAAAAWHTMQAETAMGALCCGSDNYEIRRAGRISDAHREQSEAIRALTPPADMAAKIGGE